MASSISNQSYSKLPVRSNVQGQAGWFFVMGPDGAVVEGFISEMAEAYVAWESRFM